MQICFNTTLNLANIMILILIWRRGAFYSIATWWHIDLSYMWYVIKKRKGHLVWEEGGSHLVWRDNKSPGKGG